MRLMIAAVAVGLGLTAAPALAGEAQQLYVENCSACHQVNGQGIPGAFPGLVGNKVTLGDPVEPVTRVLKGRGGMPAFASELSDLEVAQVLTYVRGAWGNRGKPVLPAQVAALRVGPRRDSAKTVPTR